MDTLLISLAPLFIVGLALQTLFEFLDPVVEWLVVLRVSKPQEPGANATDQQREEFHQKDDQFKKAKKGLVVGISSLIGVITCVGLNWTIVAKFNVAFPQLGDNFIAGLIVGGGTDSLNSIVKFLGYKKDKADQEAKEAKEERLKLRR